jgi:nuclear transport factor 2 (NTF2) superfamily protein
MSDLEQRPPLPPFSYDDAVLKVRKAEDAWNGKQPEKVAMAYTPDSRWRNRSEFLQGREQIAAFLTNKWQKENDYRLIKEIWAHGDNQIAVRFVYEWHDAQGNWFRSHGNENWKFDESGLMAERHASINDVAIAEEGRKFRWPLGVRPADHPGLTELGL